MKDIDNDGWKYWIEEEGYSKKVKKKVCNRRKKEGCFVDNVKLGWYKKVE